MSFQKPQRVCCSYCGHSFLAEQLSWPRTCQRCREVEYRNPIPVIIVLLPTYDQGLLVTQRGIEPQKGAWALTSGFMEIGELPEEAAVRELFEETKIIVSAEELRHFGFAKTPDLLLLFLALKRFLTNEEIKSFEPTEEVLSAKTIYGPETLAFSSHTEMVRRYFSACKSNP